MTALLTAYWRERFPAVIFAPPALAIAAAAQAGGAFHKERFAIDSCLAFCLLAQFRLWDDIVDIDRDRTAHPYRVLVRAPDPGPFVAMCCAIAGLNVLLVVSLRGVEAVTMLTALNLAFATLYSVRPTHRHAAADLAVLVKYPALVVLLARGAGAAPLDVALAASAVFGLACAAEIWHDPTSPLRITR